MPLTTVARGRVYEWSHAVGRGTQSGTGFNYPETMCLARCGKAGRGDGEFNQPWGITLDQAGNIYVADWKNHRVQKLSPQGKFMMKIGEYGTVPVAPGAYAVSYMGPYILPSGTPGYPKAGLLNHPTDVAVDTDGDIYVADWGNHRVCVLDRKSTRLNSS